MPITTESKSTGAYKLWFDLFVMIAAHVLLLPVWILAWTLIPLLIWIGDRGPVFYRQKRVGKNGKIFTMYKFRTMVLDADQKGPAWTTAGDPRITPIGRILRRTGLDELPEVFSIWKRDMSLVGPRALDVEEHRTLEQTVPGFTERLRVLPGLTGLAQIFDQADVATDKIRYDREYLQSMNMWLDLRLLTLSVWNTVSAGWDRRSGKLPVSVIDSSIEKTGERSNDSGDV